MLVVGREKTEDAGQVVIVVDEVLFGAVKPRQVSVRTRAVSSSFATPAPSMSPIFKYIKSGTLADTAQSHNFRHTGQAVVVPYRQFAYTA